MNAPTKNQILQLYRQILRYGQQLKLTDKEYFKGRIRDEFKRNRLLTNSEEITTHFKVRPQYRQYSLTPPSISESRSLTSEQ